ncbi:MAG: alpha/beta fold hydrolase, partial [Chloroflexales bacterium]|nr:alpha/beta fold hydrolase [Chloroflexales bacterium]
METNLNGIRMRYEDVGEGKAVLLLHAFPLSAAMWQRQVDALRDGYRVIAPDLRGFGGSDAPPGPYPMDQQADDMAALLEYLGVERAAVVGLSMGGYIAFAFWRRHRDKAAALVLADTRAGADSEEARAGREANARLAEEDGPGVIADKLIPGLVAPGASQAVRDELRALITANSPEGIAGALRGMAARPDSTPDLAGIAVPVLVLVGAEDGLTPPAEADRIHQGIVGSDLAQVPAAGHLSNLEQPEVFVDQLLRLGAADRDGEQQDGRDERLSERLLHAMPPMAKPDGPSALYAPGEGALHEVLLDPGIGHHHGQH